jgi:hypothetical protein
MTTLQIAHVREQGVDLIICPLEHAFGNRSSSDQRLAISEIQSRSRSAGLAGTVVPVWEAGAGRMAFIAPTSWHAFFRSIDLRWVWLNVNRELSW